MDLGRWSRALQGLLGPRPETRPQLITYQEACLRPLILHAATQVPFYRRRFEQAGIHSGDIHTLADLSKIPITERSDIQMAALEDLLAAGTNAEKLFSIRTSGSTGSPVTIRRTMAEERLLLAYRTRALAEYGLGYRARRAVISVHTQARLRRERKQLWEYFGLLRRLQVDRDSPVPEMVNAIESFGAHHIYGSPSNLAQVGNQLTEHDRQRLKIKLVTTGAEMITPEMRQQMEQGFGAPVAGFYGSHELIYIGNEPPGLGRYRICEQAAIVEVLNEGRPALPGERGSIVITGLHLFTMPFIRYRLGDYVTLGENDGPYQTLASIDGREVDYFHLPDGRKIFGPKLHHMVRDCGIPVSQYQFVQDRPNRIRVRLSLWDRQRPDMPAMLQNLEDRLRTFLSPATEPCIEIVDSLQPVGSRKFRIYVPYERYPAWEASEEQPETA